LETVEYEFTVVHDRGGCVHTCRGCVVRIRIRIWIRIRIRIRVYMQGLCTHVGAVSC
jgi:hypothetical protein